MVKNFGWISGRALSAKSGRWATPTLFSRVCRAILRHRSESQITSPGKLTYNDRWYLDQLRTGFIAWSSTVKVYQANADWSMITWDPRSTESLDHVREGLDKPEFLESIVGVWAQESNKSTTNLDVRPENLTLIKYLGMHFPLSFEFITTELAIQQPKCSLQSISTRRWMW